MWCRLLQLSVHGGERSQGHTYTGLPRALGKGKVDSALQVLGETNSHHFYFSIIIVKEV